MNSDLPAEFRCGYVAIIGRPNVGKSTLMNRSIGQKVSITAPKPQTTRHQIIGIRNRSDAQIMYVDTPGIHTNEQRALNKYLNKSAVSMLYDVDALVFVVHAGMWNEDDAQILKLLEGTDRPVILAVNKIDLLKDKGELLPFIQMISDQFTFSDIVPISAKKNEQIDALEESIISFLPVSDPFYAQDTITTRSERFIAAEIVREQLTRQLAQELPYSLTVEIENFEEDDDSGMTEIGALIWVEKASQKGIVIGNKGARLKEIGKRARLEMNKALNRRVHLKLWVKVKEGWADDDRALRSLGYSQEM